MKRDDDIGASEASRDKKLLPMVYKEVGVALDTTLIAFRSVILFHPTV